MKRRNFIVTSLLATPLLGSTSLQEKDKRDTKGFKVNSGEGRIHGHLKLSGVNVNILDVKVSGKDTNGDLAIFEQTSLSPRRGTPLHLHHFQDEVFYVLYGEYRFIVGDKKHSLKAGDTIFLPRKVPHAWTQVSENGKMIVTLQPAGKLEDFFVTMAGLMIAPTPAEIAQIFKDNEMEIVGSPLTID